MSDATQCCKVSVLQAVFCRGSWSDWALPSGSELSTPNVLSVGRVLRNSEGWCLVVLQHLVRVEDWELQKIHLGTGSSLWRRAGPDSVYSLHTFCWIIYYVHGTGLKVYEQKHSFADMSLLFAGSLVVESWQQILLRADHSSKEGKRTTEASHSPLSWGVLIKSPGEPCVSFVSLCQFTFPEVTTALTF